VFGLNFNYLSIFEQTHLGMVIVGEDGLIKAANRVFCGLMESLPEEILGIEIVKLVDPNEEFFSVEEFSKNFPVTGESPKKFELRHVGRNGDNVWFGLTISLIDDGTTPFNNYLVTLENLSEHKKAEWELRQSVSALARSNAFIAALSQVAASIETSSNPIQVVQALGAELKRLGLESAVLLVDPRRRRLEINYISINPTLLTQVEEFTGLKLSGHSLTGEYHYLYERIKPESPSFYPDLIPFLTNLFPGSTKKEMGRAIRMAGVAPFTPAISLPLRIKDRVLGSLSVWGADLREDDIPALSIFANQVAVVIEKARLFEAVQHRARETETLRQAAAAVASALDLDQVLNSLLIQLERVIPYHTAAVMLLEEDKLRIVAGRPFSQEDRIIDQIHPADDPLILEALNNGGPLILINAQADSRFKSWYNHSYVRGWMGVPLFARGEMIGFLTIDSRVAGAYGEPQASLAQAFANEAAIAIENAKLFEETRRLSITDPLTGLYNRRYFFELAQNAFDEARTDSRSLSILMIDIDQFKQVNDNYGHAVGDHVLRNVTERCRESLRIGEVMGRYGGEEFVVLISDAVLEDALQVAERLRSNISGQPIEVSGNQVLVTASFGVAEMDSNCRDLDSLIDRADQALYKAKSAGRNCVAVWNQILR
jgi:diguanylate cyclase (GGDEF)-like protein/PAS domain S-box-containing protein